MTPELYEIPKLVKLRPSKGWKFLGWLGSRIKDGVAYTGLEVATDIPDANIAPKERNEWSPTTYEVWLSEDGVQIDASAT